MNTFERREQIIERMKIRKFDSVNNLSNEFGVSRRTIISDVQELTCSGHPIQTNIGRGGGIYWIGNKKQFPFSERELVALRNAVELASPQDKPILENLLFSNKRTEVKANYIFEILAKYRSQKELAVKLYISESYLSRLLSGQKKASAKLSERILELNAEDCSEENAGFNQAKFESQKTSTW